MKHFFLLLVFISVLFSVKAQTPDDSLVFERFLENAHQHRMLVDCKQGERVAFAASYFLGTPYVAGTLEAGGSECLQVNFRGMDCTTLVENALALADMLDDGEWKLVHFKKHLTRIRYRNGLLDGYTSRLHYTSDWLSDNVRKGLVAFVPMGKHVADFHPSVGFMSAHPTAYPALKADSSLVAVMAEQEACINRLSLKYLPKKWVTPQAPFLKTGDIVAITTDLAGLDFSHLGIALRKHGKVYLLHASLSGKKVMVSEQPLSEYLAGIKKHTGIVAVRPL